MKTNYIFAAVVVFSTIVTSCNFKSDHKPSASNDYLLAATLFQQTAAEKRALSYQAYNIAKQKLDNELKKSRLTKKLAVVVDIDETVLDNSPFEAKSILENTDYPTYWNEWCEKASAKPIAGSLEFLNYAKSQGVEVFYITNRKDHLMNCTLENLQKYNFPFADTTHLLMRTKDSNKEPRREKVESNHEIVLLIGDNLGDFLHDFDGRSSNYRYNLTDSLQYEFGNRFIMLPNPMYGTWMNVLVENNPDLSKEEKIKLLKEFLISF